MVAGASRTRDPRRLRRAWTVLLLLFSVACGPDLTVEIETDVSVGTEANFVSLEITADGRSTAENFPIEDRDALKVGLDFTTRPSMLALRAVFDLDGVVAADGTASMTLPADVDCVILSVWRNGAPATIRSCDGVSLSDRDAGVRDGGATDRDGGGVRRDAGVRDGGSTTRDGGVPPRDGGVPGRDGGHIDAGPSPFVVPPSNVDDTILSYGGLWRLTGACTFDTTNGTFAGDCGTVPPSASFARAGVDLRVVAVQGLEITSAGALTLRGSAAAVFVVRGSATIDGTIDASATPTRGGPGDDPTCFARQPTGETSRPAGGGGGGHGTPGGAGGIFLNPVNEMGGGAGGNVMLAPLSAGCPGATGGANGGGALAPPGWGGGAVQLSVSGSLTMRGRIVAAGGGGTGGLTDNLTMWGAGSGGGSGGGILLEARTLVVEGVLAATGGGGGGGAEREAAGTDGEAGRDDGMAAAGGPGGVDVANVAGRGGNGGVNSPGVAGMEAMGATSTAGGGGGGTGRIRLNAVDSCLIDAAAIVAPVPSTSGCP